MKSKTALGLVFGLGLGVVAAAGLIGLGLMGAAVGLLLWGDEVFVLTAHPLFGAGVDLVRAGALAAVPLLALWLLARG